MLTNEYLKRVYDTVLARNPGEAEFHQAVLEVLESLECVVEKHPEYEKNGIIERFVEPERFIQFSVPWVDDSGKVQRQPRLPRAVQQRHRPLQGRPALPPLGHCLAS